MPKAHKFFIQAIHIALIISLITQPLLACSRSFDDLEGKQDLLIKFGTLPTAQTFKADVGKTAAGGLLYAITKGEDGKNKFHILLGLRDDCDQYCNLGGKSESSHKTVAETAAQELWEESIGVYGIHPTLLSQKPYVDLFTKILLHRLYFLGVEYVPADYLMKRMAESDDPRSKEYRNFIWMPASVLYDAASKGKQSVLFQRKEISLYLPLLHTLHTPTSLEFLERLALNKLPKLFPSLRNRVYLADVSTPPLSNIKREQLEFMVNWRSLSQRYLYVINEDRGAIPLCQTNIASDPKRQRKVLGHSVAAHTASMNIIKEHTASIQDSLKRKKCHYKKETASDIHLRHALGKNYVLPTNPAFSKLKTHDKRVKAAFIENMNRFYRGDLSEHDTNRLWNVYSYIKKNAKYPAFVHGASGGCINLWRSFTQLHRLMRMDPLKNSLSLRGTHIYFRGIDNMKDIQKDGREHGFYSGQDRVLLCMNMALNAGPIRVSEINARREHDNPHSQSTSSSVLYWKDNHSVNEPQFAQRFEETIALWGCKTSVTSYAPFESLYQQFIIQNSPNGSNGALLVLCPLTQNARENILIEERTYSSDFDNKNLKAYYPLYRQLFQKDNIGTDDFPEVRLFLHPKVMVDFKTKSFDFHPLSILKQQNFDAKMQEISIAIMGDWLAKNRKMMPGSYLLPTNLRDFYKQIEKDLMGTYQEEKVSLKGLEYLLLNKQNDDVLFFLEGNPDYIPALIIKGFELKCKRFLKQVVAKFGPLHKNLSEEEFFDCLKTNLKKWDQYDLKKIIHLFDYPSLSKRIHKEILSFAFKERSTKIIKNFFLVFPERTLNSYFTPDELVTLFWQHPEGIVLHADLTAFSPSTLCYWLQNSVALYKCDSYRMERSLNRLVPYVPQAKELICDMVLCVTNRFNSFPFSKIVKADYFLNRVMNLIEENNFQYFNPGYCFIDLINSCFKIGFVDLTAIDNKTNEPVIFRILAIFNKKWNGIEESISSLICKQHNEFLKNPMNQKNSPYDVRNAMGETIVQHYQKKYINGSEGHWILDRHRDIKPEELRDSLSDPLCLQIFGEPYINLGINYLRNIDLNERIWLTGWAKLLEGHSHGDVTKEDLQGYLNTITSLDMACKFKSLSENNFGIYATLDMEKLKFKNIVKVSMKITQKENKSHQIFWEWQKEFSQLLMDKHQEKEFILETLKSYPFLENKKEHIFKLFLKDKYLHLMDNVINILYPNKDRFYHNEIENSNSPFIYCIDNGQYKIAQFLYKKFHHKEAGCFMDNRVLDILCNSYCVPYPKLKADFSEFLAYEDQSVNIFSAIFNTYSFQHEPSEHLPHLLQDNIHKLTHLNPTSHKPYIFELVHKAIHNIKYFDLTLNLLKNNPKLILTQTADGMNLKTIIEMEETSGRVEDRPDIKKPFHQRKNALLSLYL